MTARAPAGIKSASLRNILLARKRVFVDLGQIRKNDVLKKKQGRQQHNRSIVLLTPAPRLDEERYSVREVTPGSILVALRAER